VFEHVPEIASVVQIIENKRSRHGPCSLIKRRMEMKNKRRSERDLSEKQGKEQIKLRVNREIRIL
jgi:hypothetical protein